MFSWNFPFVLLFLRIFGQRRSLIRWLLRTLFETREEVKLTVSRAISMAFEHPRTLASDRKLLAGGGRYCVSRYWIMYFVSFEVWTVISSTLWTHPVGEILSNKGSPRRWRLSNFPQGQAKIPILSEEDPNELNIKNSIVRCARESKKKKSFFFNFFAPIIFSLLHEFKSKCSRNGKNYGENWVDAILLFPSFFPFLSSLFFVFFVFFFFSRSHFLRREWK